MKKSLLTAFSLYCYVLLNAQTFVTPAHADIDSNFRTNVNQVFGALESNRVPTGFLLDYAVDFAEPKVYNGSVLHDSTLIEPILFSEIYKTIYTSKFNSNAGALRHPAIHDSLFYIARRKQVITLRSSPSIYIGIYNF